jgi:predicted PurR-regulated permease PerM
MNGRMRSTHFIGAATPVPESVERPESQARALLQVVFVVVAIAAALWTLHLLERLVFVLILATLLAYVIAPLVQLVERPIRIGTRSWRLGRAPAIALIYLIIVAVACGTLAILLPKIADQVDQIVASAPAYTQSILAWEHGWSRYYARLRIPAELRRHIDSSVLALSGAALESARTSLLSAVGILGYVPWLVLIPVLSFFLLKDAATFRRMFLTTLPFRGRLPSHRLFEDLNETLAAYTRAQLLACVLVGTLCGLGFAALGVPYPVLLGVLAAVLEFIPLVGPLMLAIIAALVGALHSPMLAVWALAFLAALRIVEDYVIYPRLLRRTVHLHPLAVIIAVVAGAELDGVAGMFLAVPLTAVGTVAFRQWLSWREESGSSMP